LALPHLSVEKHPELQFTIFDGFQAIIEYVSGIKEISKRLQVFLIGYIENFWLNQIGAACITVYG